MTATIAGTISPVIASIRTWSVLLLIALVLAGTVSGCADDGRTMREPTSKQTTTTRPLPPTSAPAKEISETGLVLSSSDFEPGDLVPYAVTCDGGNKPPQLEWDNVPDAAVELAVTLSDQSDPEEPLLLWLVAGISPELTELLPGDLPYGAFDTLNDYGNLGFGSPCINETNDTKRDLQFRLHVLEHDSGLHPGDPGNEAWATLKAASTDTASLLMRVPPASEP